MSMCASGENGIHNWQYHGTKDGGDVWICLNFNCGETLFEPNDSLSG